MKPTRVERRRPRLSHSAADAASAAVLVALMIEPSRHANGYPVSWSLRISTAEALGMPAATFSGKLEIHFRPCARTRPPIEAGSAMIPSDGPSGKRRKWDGGVTQTPGQYS